MDKKPNQQQNLNIEVTNDVATGIYSNLAVISHTPTEMILDFAQILPGTQSAFVRSRVLMCPLHAKRLLMALNDNIQKFESQFGTITDPTPAQQQPAGDTVPYDIIGKA